MSSISINDKTFTIMDYSTPMYVCAKFKSFEDFHEFFDAVAVEDIVSYEVTIGRKKTQVENVKFGLMDIVHEDGEITANATMRELTDPEQVAFYINQIKDGTNIPEI